jgi:hypothetical protein
MSPSTRRLIARWIHLLFALPLIGVIYGPAAETEPHRPCFQIVYFPVVVLSGLWMWKGQVVRNGFSRSGRE